MAKWFHLSLFAMIILSGIAGCSRGRGISGQDDRAAELPYDSSSSARTETAIKPEIAPESPPPAPQAAENDSSIDRAFTRIAAERREELEGNTKHAYLYALAWQEEYHDLSFELLETAKNPSWYDFPNDRQVRDAAI